MRPSFFTLLTAVLLAGAAFVRAETHVVHGDASKLPPPDFSRQIDRKLAPGFQKNLEPKSVSTGAFQTRAWTGTPMSAPARQWSNPTSDYYARSIPVGAFEGRGAPPSSWSRNADGLNRGALPTATSAFDERGTAIPPKAIPAEPVELPPDLSPQDVRKKFRTSSPVAVVETASPTGKGRNVMRATTEREVVPVTVGGKGPESKPDGEVRDPPGTTSRPTPAVSK